MSPELLQQLLFFFGVGFFVANLKVGIDLLRYLRRKRSALLIWQNPKPRYYHFSLALGVVLVGLFGFKLFVQHREMKTAAGRGDDVGLLRASRCRSARRSPAVSTRTASGPTPVSCGGARSPR